MNNMHKYDLKKDMSIEIIEIKKGLFTTQKKHVLKAITVDDLEDWCKHFDKIMKI